MRTRKACMHGNQSATCPRCRVLRNLKRRIARLPVAELPRLLARIGELRAERQGAGHES